MQSFFWMPLAIGGESKARGSLYSPWAPLAIGGEGPSAWCSSYWARPSPSVARAQMLDVRSLIRRPLPSVERARTRGAYLIPCAPLAVGGEGAHARDVRFLLRAPRP